jgi:hypothetical protein
VSERPRASVTLAAFFAALAGAAPAIAQEVVIAPEDALPRATATKNDITAQNAAFEVRFGPYRPKIDDNVASPVYDDFFGNGRRFMFGFELDWQALRIPYVGSLGVAGGWGYTQMSATNRVPEGEDTTVNVAQESSLNIMPLTALGVLRVDVLARRYAVPIVPYAKLGLAWAFWWVNDGVGTATADGDGSKGKDISVGTQASLGGMFLLDILEPSAALAADVESGVNNSYLFFEWSMSNYGGDQMNVGSSNWVTGLAFEM